jgi:hypothetical protein
MGASRGPIRSNTTLFEIEDVHVNPHHARRGLVVVGESHKAHQRIALNPGMGDELAERWLFMYNGGLPSLPLMNATFILASAGKI